MVLMDNRGDRGGAVTSSDRVILALLICAYAGLVLIRMPDVLDGRLWAEDKHFFLDALRLPWYRALFTQHSGYLDLPTTVLMQLATRLVSLENAPLVSVFGALAIQLCPAILLATSGLSWVRRPALLAIGLVLIAVPPVCEEVWLSPIMAQYHCMVGVAVILAADVRAGPIGVFRNSILVLAAFSGPGPLLLVPLFWLRAVLDRSQTRGVQALLLTLPGLVQISVFLQTAVPQRKLGIDFALFPNLIFLKHLALPLLGRDNGAAVADQLLAAYRQSQTLTVPSLCVLTASGGLIWGVVKSGSTQLAWLSAATVLIMICSYFGALGDKERMLNVVFGQRYAYAPQALLSLILLGITISAPGWFRLASAMFVSCVLVVGASGYFVVNPYIAYGPSWRQQVTEWRVNPDKVIVLWPPNFTLRLP